MVNFFLSIGILLVQALHAATGFDVADFHQCQSAGANFAVTAKNVGQGSCSLLKNRRNSHYFIVDAGTSSDAPLEIINRIAIEFGMGEVHTDLPEYANRVGVITSHSDKDHINIFSKLFNLNVAFFRRLTQFILGDRQENYSSREGKDLLENVVEKLDADKRIAITEYVEDVSLESTSFVDAESLEQQTHLSILCSNAGHDTSYHDHENTNSAIIRFSIKGQNILIMGDASGFTTRRYMINPDHRKAIEHTQLLVESHHGASDKEGANDGLWLSQIRPKHVAISAGYFGGEESGYYHPHVEPFIDLIMVGSLGTTTDLFDYRDVHHIALGIADMRDQEYMKKQLHPFFTYVGYAKKPQWLIFQTQLPIYSTATSGDLRYIFSADGALIDFSREY